MDSIAVEEMIRENDSPVIVVSLEDKVVGGAQLVYVPYEDYPDRWYIDSFLVHPDHRKKGVGTAIADYGFNVFVEEGQQLVAIVAAYKGIQSKKFRGMGFSTLYKKEALAKSIPFKEDWYSQLPKNHCCSVMIRQKT